MSEHCILPVITVDAHGVSIFCEQPIELTERNGMLLSVQQNAVNFRLRKSKVGYFADWHVAGDPTLMLILEGTLRIALQNGEYKDFSLGDMFIAKDYILQNVEFNNRVHGHTAQVIGEHSLSALHLKLESL